jgi:hypothetical protein
MVRDKGHVLLLEPQVQRNITICAVVSMSSDGLGTRKLEKCSQTSSHAYLLNCSHSVLQNLSKSFDPEWKGGAYPL